MLSINEDMHLNAADFDIVGLFSWIIPGLGA